MGSLIYNVERSKLRDDDVDKIKKAENEKMMMMMNKGYGPDFTS